MGLTQGNAHASDINVIDWNPSDPFIVSGGDDGMVKVWDLRSFGGITDPVATFKHHNGPVTSVEWNQNDSTVFASSGDDDQVALWDLALEKEIEEIHWHAKVPGLIMATSHTGFDIFRTISV